MTKDIEVHTKNIVDAWKEREIEFVSNNSSLISVFFQDEDGYLFIGHTGVLVEIVNDELFFIE